MSTFYITTPIYYVNGPPHLGHAYATIASDALARFHRAVGDETYFLTGTDEHGQKIETAAAEHGQQPHEFADAIVAEFRAAWKHLDIANDDFIRTTEERHERIVLDMWRRIEAAGDIYLGAYEGLYCIACEGFYTDSQLLPGKRCPTHETEVSEVSEPSYFFRMSNYAEPLLEHIAQNPGFIRPENYRNEVVAFVKGGLRDLSISRTTFKWGVPVPGDADHVVYVWLDALTNYISALGGPDGNLYRQFWPADCHLIGKDILRFHAVYWPCMLLSAGLPLPRTIFTTGFWTVRGKKIAKAMPATRVEPKQLADDIGVDALRYFLLREVPLGLDGDFSYTALIDRYNADLANDLGNLLSRLATMVGKFCTGTVPPWSSELAGQEHHAELRAVARQSIGDSASHYADFAPSRALESIWSLVRQVNRYVDACQPWKLAKVLAADADPIKRATLDHVMRSGLEALYCAARMMAPAMPAKAAELLRRLGLEGEARAEALASWPDPERFGRELRTGAEIERGDALFPRIDDQRTAALLAKWLPESQTAQDGGSVPEPVEENGENHGKRKGKSKSSKRKKTGPSEGLVAFDHFAKLELRVAEIKSAEPVAGTDKLLAVQLDVGGDTRSVVAGIAGAYQPEELIGRKVIFVANLEPATIRGVRSEGMILAAGDKKILGLSAIDRDVPTGTRVR